MGRGEVPACAGRPYFRSREIFVVRLVAERDRTAAIGEHELALVVGTPRSLGAVGRKRAGPPRPRCYFCRTTDAGEATIASSGPWPYLFSALAMKPEDFISSMNSPT